MSSFPELFALSGRRALVTGAASGIGYAIARALADAGAELALHTARNLDAVAGYERSANDLAAEICQRGQRAIVIDAFSATDCVSTRPS